MDQLIQTFGAKALVGLSFSLIVSLLSSIYWLLKANLKRLTDEHNEMRKVIGEHDKTLIVHETEIKNIKANLT